MTSRNSPGPFARISSQTVKFILMLEVKRRDFQTETGSALDPDVRARILGSAIDEDTLGRLEDSGVDIKSYEAIKVWVKNRHTKQQSRQAGKVLPKSDDKTVHGVHAAQGQPQLQPPPLSACSGGCGGCAIHCRSGSSCPSI